jgi:hypothetical protein
MILLFICIEWLCDSWDCKMATDYLTCGQCLREFPLQCITLFIQHKKLDCDDDTDIQNQDPGMCCPVSAPCDLNCVGAP